MKNTFGNAVTLTIFGESHGNGIGAVLDGLAPGIAVDPVIIAQKLALRRPLGKISTARSEPDPFVIESGVFEGRTTGTPICLRIPNTDTKSGDYKELRHIARPGHADFTAFEKYNGYADYRGGGHFSGRITAALVAAGAVLQAALEQKEIFIGTHISKISGVSDDDFSDDLLMQIKRLAKLPFAVLNEKKGALMKEEILRAKQDGDSVGGTLETAIVGLPAGVGEPWFDSLESLLSHALFSIPAVKGVSFGDGFSLADMRGSEANDAFAMRDGRVVTCTNHNGGINGGISNGMPVRFAVAIKPTPTIGKAQNTVDFWNGVDTSLAARGRHDPCIVHRAAVVVNSVSALVLADLLAQKYGTDWLAK